MFALASCCGAYPGAFNGLTSHYNATAAGAAPTADDFWNGMLNMYNGGPRLTGNAAHHKFLNTIESELTGAGFTMQRDVLKFPRWDVTNYSLVIHGADGDTEVQVAYPYVRSGLTPADGVTGDLGGDIYVSTGTMTVLGPTGCSSKSKATVCCITNTPHVQLKGDYQPFTPGIPKHQIPTLMVGSDACAVVQAAAKGKGRATLKLLGTQADDETAHLWGTLALHKRDVMRRVKVAVAPEHFGTMQWHVDRKGAYVATGSSCSYTAYGSSLKLRGLISGSLKKAGASNYVALTGPIPEEAGSALGWRLHGVPTIGGISLPDYLVNLDHGGPDKLDKSRFFQFASGYLDAIEQLLAGTDV